MGVPSSRRRDGEGRVGVPSSRWRDDGVVFTNDGLGVFGVWKFLKKTHTVKQHKVFVLAYERLGHKSNVVLMS